jgi:hypothetical protein
VSLYRSVNCCGPYLDSFRGISHYEELVLQEGMSWGLDAAIRGATERLVHPSIPVSLEFGIGFVEMTRSRPSSL